MADDRERPRPPRTWTKLVLLALAASLAIWLAGCGGDAPADDAGPLRLGLMVNLSEGAPARAVERQRAFELAIQHVNAAGGVFGQPVEFVVGDSTLDPEKAVAVARRLVEEEGVHAIVGPTSSANALAVAEQVSGPAGIPTVSPSATSPALALVNDGDFFFRTTLSDGAQGPVLARVAREQGFENVGVLYRNDSYGRGAVRVLSGCLDGSDQPTCHRGGQASHLPELRQLAEGGATALVAITFESEGVVILQEALDSGLFTRFAFGDALKSPDLVQAIGGDRLGGMYGTAGASDPDNPSAASWDAAFAAEYGAPPAFAYTTGDLRCGHCAGPRGPGRQQRGWGRHQGPAAGRRGRAGGQDSPGGRLHCTGAAAVGGRRRGRLRRRRLDAGLGRQRRTAFRAHRGVAVHGGGGN